MIKDLFKGKTNPFGGLSNEEELARKIQSTDFRINWTTNAWCQVASALFYKGGKIDHWKWKSEDKNEVVNQFNCLNAVLGGWGLKHEDKIALAGYMLSEMLNECPEYKEG